MCNSVTRPTSGRPESDKSDKRRPKRAKSSLLSEFITFVTFVRNRQSRPAGDGVLVRLLPAGGRTPQLSTPREGAGRFAKCDSKWPCSGPVRKVSKSDKTVIFLSSSRARRGIPELQLPPRGFRTRLIKGVLDPSTPDRCPIPSFTPLCTRVRFLEEPSQLWAIFARQAALPRLPRLPEPRASLRHCCRPRPAVLDQRCAMSLVVYPECVGGCSTGQGSIGQYRQGRRVLWAG